MKRTIGDDRGADAVALTRVLPRTDAPGVTAHGTTQTGVTEGSPIAVAVGPVRCSEHAYVKSQVYFM